MKTPGSQKEDRKLANVNVQEQMLDRDNQKQKQNNYSSRKPDKLGTVSKSVEEMTESWNDKGSDKISDQKMDVQLKV